MHCVLENEIAIITEPFNQPFRQRKVPDALGPGQGTSLGLAAALGPVSGVPRPSPGSMIHQEDSQNSAYSLTYSYDLLQPKNTKQNQQKTPGTKAREDQA